MEQHSIGTAALPASIRNSKIFTPADLTQLGSVIEIPIIDPSFDDGHLKQIIQYYNINPDEMETELHHYAKKLLDEGKTTDAWQVLLAIN